MGRLFFHVFVKIFSDKNYLFDFFKCLLGIYILILEVDNRSRGSLA